MKELLKMIVKAMVNHPEEIEIKETEGRNTMIIEIKVSRRDIGI